ncbi:MAG: alpha/beta hydrolase, partial [Actinomycetota bacterium]
MTDRSGGGPLLARRGFLLGAGAAAAAAGLASCGLFDDGGPRRIDYGDEPSQFGELYLPAADEPWPTVVMIHGGSWEVGTDLSITRDACEDLRDRGYAVWNIEYRRVGEPGGGFPGTLDDVAAAIDRLTVIGADEPLALDRLLVMGHSAGGTLALWAASRDRLPVGAPGAGPAVEPRAAISLAGVPDLALCSRANQVDGACTRFVGGTPSERPDRYAVMSPIELLPTGRPTTLVHGTDDVVV